MDKNRKTLFTLTPFLLLMWGSFAAVSKLALKQLDSFQMQFYMFGFSALVMTIILFATGKVNELRRLSLRQVGVLGLIGLPSYFYYFFYTLSLGSIPAMEASMLNYLFPIMIMLLAIPINKEKLNFNKVMSICLGFIGMLVIIFNGNLSNIRLTNISGDAFALAAAVSWGLFSNIVKKNNIDMVISNFTYTMVSFILSIVSVILFSEFVPPDTVITAGWLAYAGITNIVLSNFIWFRILRATSASVAANLSFITPFITIIFIAVLIGETITFPQMLGFLIIMLSNVIQSSSGKR